MSCTPLSKTVKPVGIKQRTRLPCLVVYVKFQFVYTTTDKIGSQLSLAPTSANVQRGSKKAFNECPLWDLGPNLVTIFTFYNELSDKEKH